MTGLDQQTGQRSSQSKSIAELGHVGLYTEHLDIQVEFYRDIVGLTVTDADHEIGMVFLSARPEKEHHELLLARGRTADADAKLIQQVSFRCHSLEALKSVYARLLNCKAPIDMVVSHGNAVGVYFRDPEGNRLEAYWQTGLQARQPFLQAIDLTKPVDKIWQEIESGVARYGTVGYVDESLIANQELG